MSEPTRTNSPIVNPDWRDAEIERLRSAKLWEDPSIYDDLLNVAHMVLTTATVYTPPELVKAAEAALRKAGEIPGEVGG